MSSGSSAAVSHGALGSDGRIGIAGALSFLFAGLRSLGILPKTEHQGAAPGSRCGGAQEPGRLSGPLTGPAIGYPRSRQA